jgi:hypothetical protein
MLRSIPLLLATAGCAVAAPSDVPYPQGYRDWHHVKSMVIERGHPLFDAFGGIHHLYANPKAMAGYARGRFADGSVIVLDLLGAERSDDAISEGPRKIVGVMVKDSHRYAATGGWGFEGFRNGDAAQRAVGADAATACFACHASRKEHDYVFSRPTP